MLLLGGLPLGYSSNLAQRVVSSVCHADIGETLGWRHCLPTPHYLERYLMVRMESGSQQHINLAVLLEPGAKSGIVKVAASRDKSAMLTNSGMKELVDLPPRVEIRRARCFTNNLPF